jgi:uncharacterized membrane protein YhaH (DUF805 family)
MHVVVPCLVILGAMPLYFITKYIFLFSPAKYSVRLPNNRSTTYGDVLAYILSLLLSYFVIDMIYEILPNFSFKWFLQPPYFWVEYAPIDGLIFYIILVALRIRGISKFFRTGLKTFRNYVNFTGRASRYEYWTWIVFQLVLVSIYFALRFRLYQLGLFRSEDMKTFFVNRNDLDTVKLLLTLPSIWVLCRRLHDANRAAWWVLALLTIPVGQVFGYTICNYPYSLEPHAITVLIALFVLCTCSGTLFLLVMAALPGTNGPNKYGLEPKSQLSSPVAPPPPQRDLKQTNLPPRPQRWPIRFRQSLLSQSV